MPHISKRKLDPQITKQLEKSMISLLRNTGSKTRMHVFEELLTDTEQIMLAKRIGILYFLDKGLSPYKISSLLGVSPSTVERFQNALSKGHYKNISLWVRKNSDEGKLETLLESLVALAFTGRVKSFKKFVDEV